MTDYRFKLVLLGEAAVGKTSLFHRFISGEFNDDYSSTIGAKFLTKVIEINTPQGLEQVSLAIWDVAGQPRFEDLRTTFYRGASGALLLFDITRKESFEKLPLWLKELNRVMVKNIPYIIIGNKIDLIKKYGRQVETKDVKEYVDEIGSIYIETSAKTGENVENAFLKLTELMVANLS